MANGRLGVRNGSMYCPHDPVDLVCDDPSRTRQEFAEECDVNNIMRRFEATGVVSHVNQREPMYLDLSEGVPDLQSAIDLVRVANESFMTLPARVRAEFENDPVKFVEFCGVPENLDKLREWGLAPVPVPEKVTKVEVVNTAAPAAE